MLLYQEYKILDKISLDVDEIKAKNHWIQTILNLCSMLEKTMKLHFIKLKDLSIL